MAELKKVKIIARVGDPRNGVIIQPGTTVDLPEVWADRYIANGSAELVDEKPKPTEPEKKPAKSKKK